MCMNFSLTMWIFKLRQLTANFCFQLQELQEKSADAAESTDAEPIATSQPSDSSQANAPDTDKALIDENSLHNSVQQPAASLEVSHQNADSTERPPVLVVSKPRIESLSHESTNIPKDLTDDMDLDFEEISDGELEEEARIRGLGDALGVDWASLVEESRAIAREKSNVRNTSAKQRWQPHRILLDVGISLKMAGTKFGTDMLRDVYAKLEQEELIEKRAENNNDVGGDDDDDGKFDKKKIKCEADADVETNEMMVEVKKELKTDVNQDDVEEKNEQKPIDVKSIKVEPSTMNDMAFHPIASVQVAYRENMEKRRGLVFNATGPYSRALSARRDLQMRQQLCGQSIRKPIRKCSANDTKDKAYRKIALEFFQKSLGEVR